MERNPLYPGIPLFLRENRGCACGNNLKERDKSVPGLPRSMSGKVQLTAPEEEKEPMALWSGNCREAGEPALAKTAGRWQDKGHPFPVRRDGNLAAKET